MSTPKLTEAEVLLLQLIADDGSSALAIRCTLERLGLIERGVCGGAWRLTAAGRDALRASHERAK
jgi:hypothetical protein